MRKLPFCYLVISNKTLQVTFESHGRVGIALLGPLSLSSYALLSTELPFYKKHPKLTGAALGVTGSVVLALVVAVGVLVGCVVLATVAAVGALAGSVVLATVAAVGVLIATVFASGGVVIGKRVFCSSREIRC